MPIFEQAASRPVAERAAFLAEACADDGLRTEVESLLRHAEDDPEDRVVSVVAEAAAAAFQAELATSETLRPGAKIDNYTIASVLGAGGMGVVYLANDDRLQREVAIKVVRRGAFGDRLAGRDVLLREAQALARVTHPNIVTVYEAGLVEDQVFIAMEYVAGTTLRAWLREPRAWREVVRHLVAAGRGLAAAHRVDQVHRDFKPDNILVGDDGRVRVADFGLAASEVAGGTPGYIAPEQTRGGAGDARSDQYAFGVTLAEALTGAPAWVRAVAARAQSPDPEHRFATMDALVAELSRDPAVRRRWIATGVLVAGLGVIATLGWSRTSASAAELCPDPSDRLAGIWDEAVEAKIRTRFAASQRPYAAAITGKLVAALDRYTETWAAARQDACRATAIHRDQSEAVLDLRMRCYDRRAGELGALTTVFATSKDPIVVDRAIQAVAELPALAACSDVDALSEAVPPPLGADAAIAAVRARLDVLGAQMRAGHEAGHVPEATAIVAAARATGYASLHAEALLALADSHRYTDQLAAATSTLDTALEIAARAKHDVLLARAWKARMLFAKYQAGPAAALAFAPGARAALVRAGTPPDLEADFALKYASALDDAGEFAAARTMAERALAIYDGGVGGPLDRARTLNQLALVLQSQGDHAGARERIGEAVAIWERELDAEHPSIAGVLMNLASLETDAGDYEAAERNQRRSLAIWEKVYGPEHRHVAGVLTNLAQTLRLTRRFDEARGLGERALAIKLKVFGDNHPQVTTTLGVLGFIATQQADYPAALAYHERGLAIRQKTLAPGHVLIADSLDLLGDVHQAQGDLTTARDHYVRAVAIWRKAVGPVHEDLAKGLGSLADNDLRAGRLAEADTHIREALAIDEKVFGGESVKLTLRFRVLAKVLLRQRRFAELRDVARRWATIAERHPRTSDHAAALVALGDALLALGSPGEAIAPLERALELGMSQPDNVVGRLRFDLARALWDGGGDRRRAVELATAARASLDAADQRALTGWLASHRASR